VIRRTELRGVVFFWFLSCAFFLLPRFPHPLLFDLVWGICVLLMIVAFLCTGAAGLWSGGSAGSVMLYLHVSGRLFFFSGYHVLESRWLMCVFLLPFF
jgi:hypothetical protein